MKHDTSEIESSLFKMTFNLKGSVDQEYSFIVKMYKKIIFRQTYFNRVIELNQIMIILSKFLTIVFYVIMTTELFINYFCIIKLCCL
jgi:hypothetical protein